MIYNYNLLIYFDSTIVNLAHTNPAYIFIVIYGADQHLGTGRGITFRSRDVRKDGIKKRHHIDAGLL